MPPPLTLAQKRSISLLLFLVPFLMGMGVDSFVPSLPAISHYFKAAPSLTQLTIGFYMLGYALGQISWGILSDTLGRRKLMLIMGALFVWVSFASSFSPNVLSLILCRFLQGLTIAGPAVIIRAIATDCFSDLELTKAMSFIATSWSLGPIIGPFIGGYLQHYFGWKANFYFLALYGLCTFGYAAIVLKETHMHRVPFHLPKLYRMLKEVSTHPLFLIYVTVCTMLYSSLVMFNVVGPFLIQVNLGYSVIAYGWLALLLGLGYFLGNLLNRYLLRTIQPMKLVSVGLHGMVVTTLIMLSLSLVFPVNLAIVIIPTFILFCFSSLAFPNMMGASARLFPKMGGTSSAVFGSFVTGGVFIFSSLATCLPTHSETPLTLMYLGMFLLSLILYKAKISR